MNSLSPPKRKNSSSRKQKRRREEQAGEEEGTQDYHHDYKRRNTAPLKGKLFAVSTLVEASSDEIPEAYSQLIMLCKDSGAQTTGQVHRRVDAVIATNSAVQGNTQRVRQAWKRGIPVVDPEWIRTSVKQGRAVDTTPFLQSEPLGDDSRPNRPIKKLAKFTTKDSITDSAVESVRNEHPKEKQGEEEVVIDLGCCCNCHDASSGRTECAWCVDCSVNRQLVKKEQQADEVVIDLGCCCVCHDTAIGRTECAWCVDCSVNQKHTK